MYTEKLNFYIKSIRKVIKLPLKKEDNLASKSFINEPLDSIYSFFVTFDINNATQKVKFYLENDNYELQLTPNFKSEKIYLKNKKIVLLNKKVLIIKKLTFKNFIKYILKRNK